MTTTPIHHPTYPGSKRPVLVGDRVTSADCPDLRDVVCRVEEYRVLLSAVYHMQVSDCQFDDSVELTVRIPADSVATLRRQLSPYVHGDISDIWPVGSRQRLAQVLEAVRLAANEQEAGE